MYKKLIYFFIALLMSVNSWGQENFTVRGTVTGDDGAPVVGATVLLKGSNKGTVTDTDGKYSLVVPSDGTLIFRFIGMTAVEKRIAGKAMMNVTLSDDSQNLEEVVVVAYGTQSKRTVTSSIASVKTEAIKDVPVNSIDQALQGRATGVSIITPSGGVGESPIIRIRGVSSITSGTSPLYVVDGVPIETGNTSYSGNVNSLADINPNDILSMDVLKDAAAAAMYGSRAANGVILITTKKGVSGKTKVSYNGYMGVTSHSHFLDVMDAQQYVDFKNMAVKNRYGTDEMSLTANYTSAYGTKAFNMWKRSDGSYVDTDWEKEVFRTGFEHNHTVSIEGGTDKGQFYISGNYVDQKGMVRGDKYNRFGLSANGSAKATEWLKIGGSINSS
ncbi:MAG: SusC/RagA family TonB-linked outer membrane protein, partial [Parabacteroides sp.]|nr:SusC/RagA family TonB-linked outer membrane protein [Parabacteroides sp.]